MISYKNYWLLISRNIPEFTLDLCFFAREERCAERLCKMLQPMPSCVWSAVCRRTLLQCTEMPGLRLLRFYTEINCILFMLLLHTCTKTP